jgi:hypothetical protein
MIFTGYTLTYRTQINRKKEGGEEKNKENGRMLRRAGEGTEKKTTKRERERTETKRRIKSFSKYMN